MSDTAIIDLYLARDESAISETEKQYGAYCLGIAVRILHNREDAAEVVNDAYLAAWNAIPPEKPRKFSTFLGRIARNLSLDRAKSANAQKRGGGETVRLLSELEGCVPDSRSVEDAVDNNILEAAINSFLSEIDKEDTAYFVYRYWHGESVGEIARQFAVSEGKVAMNLCRTRKKLKIYLEKRGVYL
jgi:RNA polymerase sigma-70 factor (ECF subfamily)